MTATCENPAYGLVPGHSYTVLDVQQLPNEAGKPEILIKMRNPINPEKYEGSWSANDKKWSELNQQRVGGPEKTEEEQIFFMPLDHFKNAFGQMNIAMFVDSWKSNNLAERGSNEGMWSYAITNP